MSLFSRFAKPDIDRLQSRQDVRRLWEILRKNDPDTRGPAKQALVAIGAPAVPTLVLALTEPNHEFPDGTSWHSKARRVLDLMGAGVVVPELATLAGGDDDRLQVAAIQALRAFAARDPLAAKALVDTDYRVLGGLIHELQTAANPAQVARILLNTGHDRAVEAVIQERTRRPRPYDIELDLIAAMAECGDERTDASVEWALTNSRHVMELPGRAQHPLESLQDGPVPPRLRTEINEVARRLHRPVHLSSRATLLHEGSQWWLRDQGTRYLLMEGGEERRYSEGEGEFVTVRHLEIYLSDDDPRLDEIWHAFRMRQRSRLRS